MQRITSAATSINRSKVPVLFKKVVWEPATINLDLGGGKFDTASEYLGKRSVMNVIYDPFNRTVEENALALQYVQEKAYATVTLSNVLNVIQNRAHQVAVLSMALRSLRRGRVYITVYEGDKSGKGTCTSKGYQHNKPLRSYMKLVRQVFASAIVEKGMIICTVNYCFIISESIYFVKYYFIP
jgi:hypothetical protein